MTEQYTDFEQFLQWFCTREEISLQARHDFLAHIIAAGEIDEQAGKFLQDSMDYLSTQYERDSQEYQEMVNLFAGVLKVENKEECSAKENIVEVAEENMLKLAVDFKEDYQAQETAKNVVAETAEQSEEDSQVAALKANLS
jgi:hypothetical protein